jgi:hypothetical protein
MSLKTLGEIREEVAEYLGMTVVDDTTTPSEARLNSFINDVARETMSKFNFRQLETSCRIPFYHTISNVQGAYLSGISTSPVAGSGITASIVPYPADNLLVNCQVIDSSMSTYSGITFTGTDVNGVTYTGVSTSGSGITGSVTTLGYSYELPANIDQIYSVVIPQNSIKLLYIPQYDLERSLPNGILTASGTPAYYTEFAGMSDDNTKSIQFFPQPNVAFSGQSFVVHYKKMQTDMTEDTDVQQVLPQQYQDILIEGTLEKVYAFLSDDKSQYHKARKEERLADLVVWANNHLDYVSVVRDGNFLGSTQGPYMTSVLFRI